MKKRYIILILFTLIFIITILGYSHIRYTQYKNYETINIVVSKYVNYTFYEYEIQIAPLRGSRIVVHDNKFYDFVRWTDYDHEEFDKLWYKMSKTETVLLLDYLFLNNIEADTQSKTYSDPSKKITYDIYFSSAEFIKKYKDIDTHRSSIDNNFVSVVYYIVAFLYFIHKYFVFIIILILIFIGTHVLKKRSQLQVPHKQ